MEMPLTVTFEVGRAKMSISDLLSLGQGSVLELHRLVGEDLDVFVNGKLVARGEVVVYKEKFGARITEIISPTDRVKRMQAWIVIGNDHRLCAVFVFDSHTVLLFLSKQVHKE